MFVGHLGLGFAGKRAHARPSLGTYLVATMLPDLLWSLFVLAGWEHVRIVAGETAVSPLEFVRYPYSHSLVATVIWGALLGGAYWGLRGDRAGAAWLAALVVSHWVLDVVSHRPDVPVDLAGRVRLGLGLWDSRLATLLVEGGLFAMGVVAYARGTHPSDGKGRWGLVALVVLVSLPWLVSLGGTPPPGIGALIAGNVAGGTVTVGLAWWTDRHRTSGQAPGGGRGG
jgi:hypothetical protein